MLAHTIRCFFSLTLFSFYYFHKKKIIYSYKVHTRQPRDRDSSIGLAGCCSAGKTRERTAWIVGSRSAMFSGDTQENGLVEDAAEHNVNTDKKKITCHFWWKVSSFNVIYTYRVHTHTSHTQYVSYVLRLPFESSVLFFFCCSLCAVCALRRASNMHCAPERQQEK